MTAKKTLTNADPLKAALFRHGFSQFTDFTPHLDAALRSAVRATIPGRQQKRNLEPLLKQARAAFVRTLRRRAHA
jgi:hypothetical protein